jgi:hypothetical protein
MVAQRDAYRTRRLQSLIESKTSAMEYRAHKAMDLLERSPSGGVRQGLPLSV